MTDTTTKKKTDIAALTTQAEAGNAYDQYDLGEFYEKNEEFEKAVHWYRTSAEQGHRWAELRLGWAYEYDQGVEKNLGYDIRHLQLTGEHP